MNPFKILIMQPFGWLLRQLYLLVGNYGAALIIFSIAVKLILLPLNIKSKKSMMKMSRMSPRLKALEKKYGDDKLKYQTAVSQLYKDEGVNPMGGCLWSFVPLLILWPLYYVIKDPLTYIVGLSADQISLVQTTLTGLGVSFEGVRDYYLQVNMAGYIHEFYNELHAVIPGLMDMNFDFFGINLANQPTFSIWKIEGLTWGDVGLWLLPFVSGLANFASSWLSQKLNGSVATNDKGEVDKDAADAQAANMKGMMYMMPLMSIWIGFSVPGGLSIYWIAQAITNFIQEFFLTKHYRKVYDAEDAVKAELYAQREAEEAERERLREEKRKQNALAGNVNTNTSKRKLKNQQKAMENTSEEGKWSAEERAKKQEEREGDDTPNANFSGDPERPYARGRAYKPNRFGRNTMESGTPEEESRSAEEE